MHRASYEDLVKLVKEHGTFEADTEGTIDGALRIDLSGTGYSKQYNRLEVVLNELYPDHEAAFDLMDIFPEENIFKIRLVDKNWREDWYNPLMSKKEHWEQKALAHIKETAEVIFYGDTSLPDAEKEAICKVSFKLSDYGDGADSGLDDCETCESFFYDVVRYKQESGFTWGDGHTYTVDGTVYVVLLSKALYQRRLREFCESV
jgi:hypothetical protein